MEVNILRKGITVSICVAVRDEIHDTHSQRVHALAALRRVSSSTEFSCAWYASMISLRSDSGIGAIKSSLDDFQLRKLR